MKTAIIDLGTNAARLFIFELSPNAQPSPLFQERIVIALGKTLYEDHLLSDEAIALGVETFKSFRRVIDDYNPEIIKAIATSALRTAENSDAFITAIKESAGIELEIISDHREAELLAKGIIENEHLPDEPTLLIDVGGGSTEVVCCRHKEVAYDFSLEIGALRGQEIHLKTYPPVESGIESFREEIRSKLAPHIEKASFETPNIIIGSSGSLRAFGRIHENIDGTQEYSKDFLSGFISRLSEMNLEEIDKVATMLPRRAEHILAAAIITEEILDAFGADKVRPSAFAIKDGLLEEVKEQIG